MDSQPDIVMVMTDQHAARIMGCAGDPIAKTPALDALAQSGTRFENAYCNAPLCVPSRMSFLTGLEPHKSGVLNNDTYLPSDIPTLAHALGAAGYACHLVGRMHFYGPDQLHGFEDRPIGDIAASYPGGNPPDIGDLTKGRGNRGPELAFSGAGETSYQAYDLAVAKQAEETIATLKEQRARTGQPFFVLVSLFCPHPPYICPRDDFDDFARVVPPPRLTPPKQDHPAIADWRKAGGTADVSPASQETSRAAYYGLVQTIDRICGRVFDLVKDQDNTLSIYTSDHGDCLGERGLWWKSVMYDQSAKIPLILRGPDVSTQTTDTRVASLVDLTATILDYAGTDALPGACGQSLRGPAQEDLACFSSYYGGLMNIQLPHVRHRMVRQGRYKLMWFDGARPLLFDLDADPDELVDLARDADHADVLLSLTSQVLEGWPLVEIARKQVQISDRTEIIRNWVKRTNPPEPSRWVDPQPERNQYN